ncbi:Wzz/FepE/Etk N-terminal domain-containing protein [Flavobacterium sp.]|uniref:Wzz/FepE/Etk N-terminal domain-containing protein n=1 Tax=Flavobacterium sp. TaxID=239 RepID=UPI00286E9930|nr:Wzz/FepE/Etk N-terminal domain-containing protein [Flavobacterium sp.]
MANQPTVKEEIALSELIRNSKEWFYFLLSKRKTIVLASILGAIVGLTYSFIKKPVYKASLSFALESSPSGGGLSGALGLASSLGFDLGGSGGGIFEGSNLTELFKSRKMVEKTLLMPVSFNGKTISLAEMYLQNEKWRKKWDNKPKLVGLQFLPNTDRKMFSRSQDSIFGAIYEDLYKYKLEVGQKDKKVDIISIEVTSTNELFSKFFTEALAKQVGDFYIETKSKKARINMAILERQTDSIRGELNSAISGVAVANDNTFGLNPSLNVRRVPSARRQVDVQANGAILTELVKQTELAKVTLRKETPLIQIIDRPILPLKKEKVGKLMGLVVGAIVFGLLTILFLTLKNTLKKLV